jgi:hypothetical protein
MMTGMPGTGHLMATGGGEVAADGAAAAAAVAASGASAVEEAARVVWRKSQWQTLWLQKIESGLWAAISIPIYLLYGPFFPFPFFLIYLLFMYITVFEFSLKTVLL